MHYLALACDYDGTLAKDGQVSQQTIEALERVVASGRKLLLVTGRLLEDLQHVFPRLDLFAYVVAENGALLYQPASNTQKLLGEAPPERFSQALSARGVPLSTGSVIVATWKPYDTIVLDVIRELGLERQVIFNKGAVMVLPSGINKGAGLQAALQELKFSPHSVVGIGDAENDHSFLALCECSIAVANALPALKEQADYTTRAERGDGVTELIGQLLANDLYEIDRQVKRHTLVLGTREKGEQVLLHPYRTNVLIAGPSGSGKSTLALGLLEQLVEHAYQFCLIDPEGDYETLQGAIILGDTHREPGASEILQLLEKPEQSVVVNLLNSSLADQPALFRNLLPDLQDLQIRLGHPHWLILDEVHHLLPAEWDVSTLEKVNDLFDLLFISAYPEHISRQVLDLVDVLMIVGPEPLPLLHAFCERLGLNPPEITPRTSEQETCVVWLRRSKQPPVHIQPTLPHKEHQRHQRKYARGNLGEDISFYFRGPEGKLNLRAQNLLLFTQIAQGVDDATWLFHLHKSDYSHWFRTVIKDEDLATETEHIERDDQLSAQESRAKIKEAIEQRYTLPA